MHNFVFVANISIELSPVTLSEIISLSSLFSLQRNRHQIIIEIYNCRYHTLKWLPYFLEISPHLKILLCSKCHRMFLQIHTLPSKSHCTVKGRQICTYAHTYYTCIQIGLFLKLCMHTCMLVHLCKCHPWIVTAPNRASKSHCSNISRKYSVLMATNVWYFIFYISTDQLRLPWALEV